MAVATTNLSDTTEDSVADTQDAIRQLRSAIAEAIIDAIDELLRYKPYATLAIVLVAGIGFLLFGAASRRRSAPLSSAKSV